MNILILYSYRNIYSDVESTNLLINFNFCPSFQNNYLNRDHHSLRSLHRVNIMIEEEFIICGNCGKQVPQSQFCINCGFNLVKEKGRIQQEFNEEKELKQYEFPKLKYNLETPKNILSREISENVKSPFLPSSIIEELDRTQITKSMDELLKYQLLRVKLGKMLIEEGMPAKVFANIWDEYTEVVRKIQKKIDDGPDGNMAKYNDLMAKLEDEEVKLEGLRVRVAIGELTDSDVLIRTPRIRENIETLKREVSHYESLIKEESMKAPRLSPKEMFEHEQYAKEFMLKIEDLVEDGKISNTHKPKIISDMENVKDFFSIIEDDSNNQELRNELELLEVRYKVGEISLGEMEIMKKEIFTKFEFKKEITQVA